MTYTHLSTGELQWEAIQRGLVTQGYEPDDRVELEKLLINHDRAKAAISTSERERLKKAELRAMRLRWWSQ